MADPDGELTVAQRLGRALDRGLLPAGGPAEAAERLIERLERPARIALLGLPGSGKSSILNLLIGSIVVPETLRLPTIIVQHGDVARMICTLTDGTTKILPGSDLAEVLSLAPALVTLEMDLPALKVISLLEVSAGPMEAEQKRAATWASKRADIVIWCTTSYLPKEQAVWESLPDAVKDNSFMFLTKVDLLGSRESASAMHDRVELRAGEEFRQILSISAKQARAAAAPGGQVNRDLFRDSGAMAVIAAIKTRVQSGRRADMDTAELLLARHVEASELVARRFAEPGEETEAPKAWTPPPEPEAVVAAPKPLDEPVAEVPVPEPVEIEEEPEVADAAALVEDAEVEVEVEVEVDDEPEPVTEPESVDEVAPEPEVSRFEPEAEPAIMAPVEPFPEAETLLAAPPEPEPEPTTRKRFADRIKRVASNGEAAAAPPMVPLRSTWKSKAETELPPEPEPEPVARPPEPTRRPRAAAAAPVKSEDDVAKMLANVVSAAETPEEPVAEPAVEPVEVPEEEPVAAPRERTPRAITPRPAPVAEAPRSARPQLFGGRRSAGTEDAPLPDLSALRATAEEMAASAEASGESVENQEPDPVSAEAALDEDWQTPTPEVEPEADAPEPEPEVIPEAAEPTAAARVARAVDRTRLFDRGRPAEPAPPPRPDPMPRSMPISRSPAPPRMPAPAAEAEVPVAARAVADDAQFSPRAIMMRERRVEPDAAAPRRERTRIAARAVPAAPAQVAVPAAVSPTDQGLVEEAIDLLITRSADLEREVDPEAKIPVDLILDHTRETGDMVMAVVSRAQSEPLRRIGGDLGEVMDLIMLMQLEKGHAPADDALTLLLQLKRELETLRAM